MMNRTPETLETSSTLALDATPLQLRLPVGAAVFAVQGTVWITQERLRDDIILSPGQRFDVKSGSLIVASAIKDRAAIHIAHPTDARRHDERDIHDFARARALRLRNEETARVARLVSDTAAAWTERIRRVLTSRPRAVTH